jgi:O-antigen ligase
MSIPAVLSLSGAIIVVLLLVIRPYWGLLALILYYPFIELIPRWGPGLNAETALFTVAILAVLVRGYRCFPPPYVFAPIVGYLSVMALSFAVLTTRYQAGAGGLHDPAPSYWAIAKLLKSELWPLLVFFVAYALSGGSRERRSIVTALALGVTIVSVAGLIDLLVGDRPYGVAMERATGLAQNPNRLGILAAAFSPIALHRAFEWENRRRERLACGIIYLVVALALVFSQSRKAWLAAVIGHFVWLAYRNRALVLPAAVALVMTLTIGYAALPSIIRDRIEATFTPGRTIYQAGIARRLDPSSGSRIVFYTVGVEMFMDSPLVGHGFHSFRLRGPTYSAKYGYLEGEDPHSLPLKVLVESGLIGFIFLLWMVAVVFYVGLRAARTKSLDRELGVCFVACCAALGVANLLGTATSVHLISVFFWIFFGCVARALSEAPFRVLDGQAEPATRTVSVA